MSNLFKTNSRFSSLIDDIKTDNKKDLKIENSNIIYIDKGDDNSHPGPEQHKQYAEKLYQFIKGN